jgi:hypothetical protein
VIAAKFDQIWCVDFEFGASATGRPAPRCLVAIEARTGRRIEMWDEELRAAPCPPFDLGPRSLYVAFAAQAELGCHLALGWPLPGNVMDLYAEFRAATNGLAQSSSLLSALTWFGLPHIDIRDKDMFRDLALRGGPYTEAERQSLVGYCASDVMALVELLPRLVTADSLNYALLRGREVRAIAVMEDTGIPVDLESLERIRTGRHQVRQHLVADTPRSMGLYEGGVFKMDRLERLVEDRGMAWPRHESGRLNINKFTFKAMAGLYPELKPVCELRKTMDSLREFNLPAGEDARMRPRLRPFASTTGRNQPAAKEHPFLHPKWLRGLIRPPPGRALAYVDWAQQEFGVAAALSGDRGMQAAYQAHDPYIAFGQQAGLLPPSATKASHPVERARLKACALGVLFGKAERSLAEDLGLSVAEATELVQAHRRAFPHFWTWSQGIVDHAMLFREAHTVFDWRLHVGHHENPRSIMNFPMQANGAELMRLAAVFAVEDGIQVCTPVHDAFLIEAGDDDIEDAVARMRAAMNKASRIVLDGFELGTDSVVVRHPASLLDAEHRATWDLVQWILGTAACADVHQIDA